VQRDVQDAGRVLEHAREADVRIGGAHVPRGVVVHEDDGRGLVREGLFEDLPRVDDGLVHDALLDRFDLDDAVPRVEADDGEMLVLQAAHGGKAVIDQFLRRGDLLALLGPLPQGEGGDLADDAEQNGRVAADSRDALQGLGIGIEHTPEGTEALQQFLRQGLHVPAGQGIEKQELQRLVVLQAGDPRPFETGLEPFAVPEVVGVFDVGHDILLIASGRKAAAPRRLRDKPHRRSR